MRKLTTFYPNITTAPVLAGVSKEIKVKPKSITNLVDTKGKPLAPRLTPYGVTKMVRVDLQPGLFLLRYTN